MRVLATLFLAFMILSTAAYAMERDELRSAYMDIARRAEGLELYRSMPDVTSKNTPGRLSAGAEALCVDYVNFLRGLAGLEAVEIGDAPGVRAQCAAYLLSVNDCLTHSPEQPEGMDATLYAEGAAGARESNIACFNWKRDRILLDGIDSYVREDGEDNLFALSHRRWLLDPAMCETGFGYARSASGLSYTAMYAVAQTKRDVPDYVAWPCGCFPAELMDASTAWSISLNDEVFDLPLSRPVVTLTCEGGGSWRFGLTRGDGDGYCRLSAEEYGTGCCLIFRPDRTGAYEQNERFHVRVEGLRGRDGGEKRIEYDCGFVSLYAQDVAAVELEPIEAALRPGETLALTAKVIPAYADDTHIVWMSDDENVAMVDDGGVVTARAPGCCRVSATAANGCMDVCVLTVLS